RPRPARAGTRKELRYGTPGIPRPACPGPATRICRLWPPYSQGALARQRPGGDQPGPELRGRLGIHASGGRQTERWADGNPLCDGGHLPRSGCGVGLRIWFARRGLAGPTLDRWIQTAADVLCRGDGARTQPRGGGLAPGSRPRTVQPRLALGGSLDALARGREATHAVGD